MSKFKELQQIMSEAVGLVNRDGYHVEVYSTLNEEEREKFDSYVKAQLAIQKSLLHTQKGMKYLWLDLCFQGEYKSKTVIATRLHFSKDGMFFTGHNSEYPYSAFRCRFNEFTVNKDEDFGYEYFSSIIKTL